MRSILESANLQPFKFSQFDIDLYNDYQNQLKIHCGPENNTLSANILFLMTNKALIDYLLKFLDDDVKKLWDETRNYSSTKIELHTPENYASYAGLRWPLPTPELASNHSSNLLSRVLLRMEQRHGINTTNTASGPVPTFLGFIESYDADDVVKRNQLWNDDPRVGGLFYHGKMTHRIQWYLLMKAIDLGMLETDGMQVPEVIKLLLQKQIYTKTLPWDALVDESITNNNIVYMGMGHLRKLAENFPTTITANTDDKHYIFGCDPNYFHSYLMTVSRAATPYLSECVTQLFCKSAMTIHRLEMARGLKPGSNDYQLKLHVNLPFQPLTNDDDITMNGTLYRQALCYNVFSAHPVEYRQVLCEQERTEKHKKIDASRSMSSRRGVVQYRLLKHPEPQIENPEGAEGSPKRRKMM